MGENCTISLKCVRALSFPSSFTCLCIPLCFAWWVRRLIPVSIGCKECQRRAIPAKGNPAAAELGVTRCDDAATPHWVQVILCAVLCPDPCWLYHPSPTCAPPYLPCLRLTCQIRMMAVCDFRGMPSEQTHCRAVPFSSVFHSPSANLQPLAPTVQPLVADIS